MCPCVWAHLPARLPSPRYYFASLQLFALFFLSVAVNVGPHDASHRTVVFRVRYLLFMWGGQSSLHSLPSATVAGTLGVRGED